MALHRPPPGPDGVAPPAAWKVAAFSIGEPQSNSMVLRTTAKATLLRTTQRAVAVVQGFFFEYIPKISENIR